MECQNEALSTACCFAYEITEALVLGSMKTQVLKAAGAFPTIRVDHALPHVRDGTPEVSGGARYHPHQSHHR